MNHNWLCLSFHYSYRPWERFFFFEHLREICYNSLIFQLRKFKMKESEIILSKVLGQLCTNLDSSKFSASHLQCQGKSLEMVCSRVCWDQIALCVVSWGAVSAIKLHERWWDHRLLCLDSTNPDRCFYHQQDGGGLQMGLQLSYVRWSTAAGAMFLPSIFVTTITKQYGKFTVHLGNEFNFPT